MPGMCADSKGKTSARAIFIRVLVCTKSTPDFLHLLA
jgi:hypothetical protein